MLKLAGTGVPLDAACLAKHKALGLRFNGAPVNKTMLQAAALVQKRFSPECRAVMQAIEFEFGRDIFANRYNNYPQGAVQKTSFVLSTHFSVSNLRVSLPLPKVLQLRHVPDLLLRWQRG